MRKKEIERLRKSLEQELGETLEHLDRLQAPEEWRIKQSDCADELDFAARQGEQFINTATSSCAKQNIERIQHALRKLSTEDAGLCEDCGAEIPIERLEALPSACCCAGCQERREERAAHFAPGARVAQI